MLPLQIATLITTTSVTGNITYAGPQAIIAKEAAKSSTVGSTSVGYDDPYRKVYGVLLPFNLARQVCPSCPRCVGLPWGGAEAQREHANLFIVYPSNYDYHWNCQWSCKHRFLT